MQHMSSLYQSELANEYKQKDIVLLKLGLWYNYNTTTIREGSQTITNHTKPNLNSSSIHRCTSNNNNNENIYRNIYLEYLN